MISNYPVLTKLSIEHKPAIQEFVAQFEPYSDFNFISLFCWNIDGSTQVAMFNSNLVIQVPDYLTGEPVISVLGNNEITSTIETLLEKTTLLKLVPENTVHNITEPATFDIQEDPDNHDYIFDLQDHVTFSGSQFKTKRKHLSRFVKDYGHRVHVRSVDLSNHDNLDTLEHVFLQWAHEKQRDNTDIENERIAIVRFLEHASAFENRCYEILIDGKLVGFSLNEVLPGKMANCHFQKCLTNYTNIDIFFTNYVAQQLVDEGCMYINWEQDLGIDGLRQLKQSYKPMKMLKKYLII